MFNNWANIIFFFTYIIIINLIISGNANERLFDEFLNKNTARVGKVLDKGHIDSAYIPYKVWLEWDKSENRPAQIGVLLYADIVLTSFAKPGKVVYGLSQYTEYPPRVNTVKYKLLETYKGDDDLPQSLTVVRLQRNLPSSVNVNFMPIPSAAPPAEGKFTSIETPGYVGFANLPNQVHRKSVKKGFEFTLMVVGESGLGKSTLVNSLFLTDLYPERIIPDAIEKQKQTVKLEASTVEIEERGVKLRLTVVDTPGFGDAIDNSDSFSAILEYIDEQYERFLRDESGLNRRNIVDNRIHCCFYFISPFGHGLKPLDVEFMKKLHSKVNIVPVIAKADCLTKKEILRLKCRIMQEIEDHGIKIYPLPDCDSDEDEDYKEQVKQLKAAVPFAVCGANTLLEVKGKKVRGRLYPWGVVEVENPEHCDFIKLRTMLITHMQDLQEVTQEVHYENYRSDRLAKGIKSKENGLKPERDSVVPAQIVANSVLTEKDRILQEKEAELRRMQEMLAQMQAQMQAQQ
uniref:Septin-type G domain-containing protein n=2 Tax=Glossina TaxID=44049 RepID=A0A1B0A9Y6_GLOPL